MNATASIFTHLNVPQEVLNVNYCYFVFLKKTFSLDFEQMAMVFKCDLFILNHCQLLHTEICHTGLWFC